MCSRLPNLSLALILFLDSILACPTIISTYITYKSDQNLHVFNRTCSPNQPFLLSCLSIPWFFFSFILSLSLTFPIQLLSSFYGFCYINLSIFSSFHLTTTTLLKIATIFCLKCQKSLITGLPSLGFTPLQSIPIDPSARRIFLQHKDAHITDIRDIAISNTGSSNTYLKSAWHIISTQ